MEQAAFYATFRFLSNQRIRVSAVQSFAQAAAVLDHEAAKGGAEAAAPFRHPGLRRTTRNRCPASQRGLGYLPESRSHPQQKTTLLSMLDHLSAMGFGCRSF